MRRTMLVLIIAAGICRAAVSPLSQDTLKGYLENGAAFDFILIDVRAVNEITTAIGNAACKPYNLTWPTQFQNECAKIPKDRTIIVYCMSGGRSARAAAYLDTNGYTSVYDAGGFLTWNGPTVPPSDIKPALLLPESSMRGTTAAKASLRSLFLGLPVSGFQFPVEKRDLQVSVRGGSGP